MYLMKYTHSSRGQSAFVILIYKNLNCDNSQKLHFIFVGSERSACHEEPDGSACAWQVPSFL